MEKCRLFITLTVQDPDGGTVLKLKRVGLEYGLRKVAEMTQDKYGRKAVRRREDVVIPPMIELCDIENAP